MNIAKGVNPRAATVAFIVFEHGVEVDGNGKRRGWRVNILRGGVVKRLEVVHCILTASVVWYDFLDTGMIFVLKLRRLLDCGV